MTSTTREQDAVIEALAVEHGATHVLAYEDPALVALDPLRNYSVLACGWSDDETGGHRVSAWQYVTPDGRCSDAQRPEVAYALELADRQAARVA